MNRIEYVFFNPKSSTKSVVYRDSYFNTHTDIKRVVTWYVCRYALSKSGSNMQLTVF